MSTRREFFTLLGGMAVASWPLAARAQQPAMPVIGVLSSRLADATRTSWLRSDMVSRRPASSRARTLPSNSLGRTVNSIGCRALRPIWLTGGNVIVTTPPSTLAAKAATSTIPLVFLSRDDPVKLDWLPPQSAGRQCHRRQLHHGAIGNIAACAWTDYSCPCSKIYPWGNGSPLKNVAEDFAMEHLAPSGPERLARVLGAIASSGLVADRNDLSGRNGRACVVTMGA